MSETSETLEKLRYTTLGLPGGYWTELQGNGVQIGLRHGSRRSAKVEESRSYTPSPEDWATLCEVTDRLRAREWQVVYPSPGIFDGHRWTLTLRWSTRSLANSGDNAYPDGFPMLEAALNRLVAGALAPHLRLPAREEILLACETGELLLYDPVWSITELAKVLPDSASRRQELDPIVELLGPLARPALSAGFTVMRARGEGNSVSPHVFQAVKSLFSAPAGTRSPARKRSLELVLPTIMEALERTDLSAEVRQLLQLTLREVGWIIPGAAPTPTAPTTIIPDHPNT